MRVISETEVATNVYIPFVNLSALCLLSLSAKCRHKLSLLAEIYIQMNPCSETLTTAEKLSTRAAAIYTCSFATFYLRSVLCVCVCAPRDQSLGSLPLLKVVSRSPSAILKISVRTSHFKSPVWCGGGNTSIELPISSLKTSMVGRSGID